MMKNSTLARRAAAACLILSVGSVVSASAVFAQPQRQGGTGGAGGAASAAAALSFEELAVRFGGVKADTKPSRDATMMFSVPTEVREVFVKGGDKVKKGDQLIRARDSEIVAVVELQKLRKETDLEVKNAEAALELAQFRFDMGTKPGTTISPAEQKELEIGLKSAKLQLEQAKVRLREQTHLLAQAEGQMERFLLTAPFDGIIEEVKVDAGQGVGEQTPALRIVNTDQLWLDAYAPTAETIRLGLKEGSPAWVLMDLPGGPKVVQGTILYVSPVADSVAQERRVRVEIVNGGNWPAGTQTRVRFTEPANDVAAGKEGADATQRAEARR